MGFSAGASNVKYVERILLSKKRLGGTHYKRARIMM